MNPENQNSKALNKTILLNAKNKITLGFRCDPKVKFNLIEKAQQLNLSLSEYVEHIVASFEVTNRINENDMKEIILENHYLKNRLAFYECEKLKELFEGLRGKKIDMMEEEGFERFIEIKSIHDVYILLLDSFSLN